VLRPQSNNGETGATEDVNAAARPGLAVLLQLPRFNGAKLGKHPDLNNTETGATAQYAEMRAWDCGSICLSVISSRPLSP
jgi:hypothetical protein